MSRPRVRTLPAASKVGLIDITPESNANEEIKDSLRRLIERKENERQGKCAYCKDVIALIREAHLTIDERTALLKDPLLAGFCTFLSPQDLSCDY